MTLHDMRIDHMA